MRPLFLVFTCFLLIACSSESQPENDAESADSVVSKDTSSSFDAAHSKDSVTYEIPDYFPGADLEADRVKLLEGLTQPVRVVEDDLGVPHIYAESLDDLLFAQGYVTAGKRLFQMHTLRMAASGRLGELLGPSSVQGDVLLRTLKLRATAEKMATRTKELYPEVYHVLERYAAGVNRFIERMNAGAEPKPLEVIKAPILPRSPPLSK